MVQDRIFGISVLIFCLIMFMETFNFAEKTPWQIAGPAVFPRFIIAVIAVVTLVLLIKSFLQKSDRTSSFSWETFINKYGKTIILFALFGVYVVLLPILSFIIATLLFLIVGQAVLMGLKKPKTIVLNLSISVIMTFSVYLIFTHLLNIWLP
ncbi:tripartite tricarboxylate transporter TctB family protein [Aquibacillus albus]|uniref:Tricarboxylic transport membrane protein n=1 Tax=Aquibacillus albus TaxID=1168171 RepID=A0ABS2MVW6_9BACI|nr:tripartite tricarboxylate transporter TctB family protein [Aquibacillus albus]MBM7570035.1 putative tricarboxylic transport membrane protein [Aquibacillus albus]